MSREDFLNIINQNFQEPTQRPITKPNIIIENNDENNDSQSFILPNGDTKLKNRKIAVSSTVNNENNSSIVTKLK